VIEQIDAGAARAGAAGFDHRRHGIFRADEDRLDATVAAVADPAAQAPGERRIFGPGTKADALDAAADKDIAVSAQ
jgi:hypothetical protein